MGLVERYVRFAWRHPWLVLACAAVATVAGGVLAMRLRVSADLRDLLPEGTASVRAMDEALARLGSTDSLTIAVQSPDRLANRRFLETVAARVERWPERPFLLWKLDVRYFLDRRLYYVDLPDLVAVRDNLQRRLRYEKVHANPAYIDLDPEPAPVIVPEEMEDRYRDRFGWKEDEGADAPAARRQDALAGDVVYIEGPASGDEEDATGGAPDHGPQVPDADGGPAGSEGEIVSALVIRFPESAVDLDFARRVAVRAECLVGVRSGGDCSGEHAGVSLGDRATVEPRAFHPDLRVDVAGGLHQRMRESEVASRAAVRSALSSLLLVAVIVAAAFRRVRAILFVLVPLVVGVVLSLGFASVVLGTLNLIAACTFAVLIGLGVDFGIHLGRRHDEERRAGASALDAAIRATTLTGRGVVGAGLTTAAAFVALLFAHFRGFREFGLLSSVSVPITLVSALALFPALLSVTRRRRAPLPGPAPAGEPVVPRVTGPAGRWGLAVLFVVLVAGGAVALPRLEFEYDFNRLMARADAGSIQSKRATRGYSGSPGVALAPTPDAARRAREAIEAGRQDDPAFLRASWSLDSFEPQDQDAKREVMASILRLLDEPSFGFVEDDMSDEEYERLGEIRGWLAAGPVDVDDADFPAWARRLFTEKDGRHLGRIVYLMPRISTSDARATGAMQQWVGKLGLPAGTVVASSGFVLADVVRSVLDDAWRIVGLATVGIVLAILLLWPSPRLAAAILVPLAGGFVVMFGLLAVLGVKITFYSVAAFPVILGTGVDGGIHLLHRWLQDPSRSVRNAVRGAGPSILLSALTTAVAFGSLMATDHRGLFSLGLVSAIGLTAVVATTVLGTSGLLLTGLVRAPLRTRSATGGASGDE